MATKLSVGEAIAEAAAANGPCFCDRSTGGTLIETHTEGRIRVDRIKCNASICRRTWKRVDVLK